MSAGTGQRAAAADPLRFVHDGLAELDAQGLRRTLRTIEGPPGPRAAIDGQERILLCSNAYLGLHRHPDVVRAAQEAAASHGTGSTGSRLISGSTDLHAGLERELADLKGQEDCVLFGTGYQANLGAVTALVGQGDLVLSDRLNHASLIDACRLSRAAVQVYDHADADDLAARLAAHRRDHRRALVVTDGVFSMDGDEAPLGAIADACEDHDAALLVDDAHGTGVLGPDGAGTAAAQGVADRVHLHMGTLSKALGSEGGFVAADEATCDWLRNRARSFVFSTAPAPPGMAAARAALGVVRREPERRERLHANAARLRDGLQALGFKALPGRTPIVPVVTGEVGPTMALMDALWQPGVYVAGIRPPTVPEGACRLRATVMAGHTEADLDEALAAFAAAGREVGLLP